MINSFRIVQIIILFFLASCICTCASATQDPVQDKEDLFHDLSFGNAIVLHNKRIILEDFPDAYNPSILKIDKGYLLTFRYCPDPYNAYWVNYIGLVVLNETFEPITKPQLLNTRSHKSKIPSQAEDARLFRYRNRIFLIYNDNLEIANPRRGERRDIFIAELISTSKNYLLSAPMKLVYEEKYNTQWWQKNWVPFVWDNTLLLSYSLDPHEIIYPNLSRGDCYHCYETHPYIDWKWGILRGSTPPILIDGEYLAFFHSGIVMSSEASWGWDLWHYFMGAYTFSAQPPFTITKMTPQPIIADGFYLTSNYEKRVIFPGGVVDAGHHLYMAYGKDDHEIWIATIDKHALKHALKPVPQSE